MSPKEKAPVSKKQYDTDTEGESDSGMMKPVTKKDQLNFDSVLKQWGVSDINKLIGTSSDDEKSKKKSPKPVHDNEETKDDGKP